MTYVGDVYSDVLYRGTNCLLTVLQWNLSVPSCQLVIRCRSRWWRPIVTLSHPINCVPYRSWTYLTQLKPFCHAMLCIGAAYAVVRCSSVWMSATFVYSDKTSKYIFKIFHRWVASSHMILVFLYQAKRYGNIVAGTSPRPNRGVKCRWGMKKWQFLTSISRCCMLSGVINTVPPFRGKLVTLCVQHSSETRITALLWPLLRDSMR